MGLAEIGRIDCRTVILWSAIQKTHKNPGALWRSRVRFFSVKNIEEFCQRLHHVGEVLDGLIEGVDIDGVDLVHI